MVVAWLDGVSGVFPGVQVIPPSSLAAAEVKVHVLDAGSKRYLPVKARSRMIGLAGRDGYVPGNDRHPLGRIPAGAAIRVAADLEFDRGNFVQPSR